MKDPLGLDSVPVPEAVRAAKGAPLPQISDLHNRITNANYADSLEVKVVILAHMLYLAYTDIKDISTK